MQTVHDLAVGRRYFTEAWNPRNLAALDDLVFTNVHGCGARRGGVRGAPLRHGQHDRVLARRLRWPPVRHRPRSGDRRRHGVVLHHLLRNAHGPIPVAGLTAPGNRPAGGSPAGRHSPSVSPTDGSHGWKRSGTRRTSPTSSASRSSPTPSWLPASALSGPTDTRTFVARALVASRQIGRLPRPQRRRVLRRRRVFALSALWGESD